ncbi:hypothetical protein JKP88DRAFT_252355 [Tribonema minus]|uniref:Uncharacterized protein n=1 Tax=Tribonema minus TaxID=303371 RepID=A0A835ZAH3_9STRA|nr:hypothetical protein JKP88DRAFT_252355 [Tribonema minus]
MDRDQFVTALIAELQVQTSQNGNGSPPAANGTAAIARDLPSRDPATLLQSLNTYDFVKPTAAEARALTDALLSMCKLRDLQQQEQQAGSAFSARFRLTRTLVDNVLHLSTHRASPASSPDSAGGDGALASLEDNEHCTVLYAEFAAAVLVSVPRLLLRCGEGELERVFERYELHERSGRGAGSVLEAGDAMDAETDSYLRQATAPPPPAAAAHANGHASQPVSPSSGGGDANGCASDGEVYASEEDPDDFVYEQFAAAQSAAVAPAARTSALTGVVNGGGLEEGAGTPVLKGVAGLRACVFDVLSALSYSCLSGVSAPRWKLPLQQSEIRRPSRTLIKTGANVAAHPCALRAAQRMLHVRRRIASRQHQSRSRYAIPAPLRSARTGCLRSCTAPCAPPRPVLCRRQALNLSQELQTLAWDLRCGTGALLPIPAVLIGAAQQHRGGGVPTSRPAVAAAAAPHDAAHDGTARRLNGASSSQHRQRVSENGGAHDKLEDAIAAPQLHVEDEEPQLEAAGGVSAAQLRGLWPRQVFVLRDRVIQRPAAAVVEEGGGAACEGTLEPILDLLGEGTRPAGGALGGAEREEGLSQEACIAVLALSAICRSDAFQAPPVDARVSGGGYHARLVKRLNRVLPQLQSCLDEVIARAMRTGAAAGATDARAPTPRLQMLHKRASAPHQIHRPIRCALSHPLSPGVTALNHLCARAPLVRRAAAAADARLPAILNEQAAALLSIVACHRGLRAPQRSASGSGGSGGATFPPSPPLGAAPLPPGGIPRALLVACAALDPARYPAVAPGAAPLLLATAAQDAEVARYAARVPQFLGAVLGAAMAAAAAADARRRPPLGQGDAAAEVAAWAAAPDFKEHAQELERAARLLACARVALTAWSLRGDGGAPLFARLRSLEAALRKSGCCGGGGGADADDGSSGGGSDGGGGGDGAAEPTTAAGIVAEKEAGRRAAAAGALREARRWLKLLLAPAGASSKCD